MDTYPGRTPEQTSEAWLLMLKETQARFTYYKAIGGYLTKENASLDEKMLEQMTAVVEATSQQLDGSFAIVSYIQNDTPLTGLVCGFGFDTEDGLVFLARQSQHHAPEPVLVESVISLQTPRPTHPAFG